MSKVSLRRLRTSENAVKNDMRHFIEVINAQGLAVMDLNLRLSELEAKLAVKEGV